MRLPTFSLAALATLSACTETPGWFPTCVDPSAPCILDGGADADAGATDAPGSQDVYDSSAPD